MNKITNLVSKKRIIIICISLLALISIIICSIKFYRYYQVKHAVIIVDLKDDLVVEFLSKVKVSDFITNINGKIINDYKIDTTKIGEKEINFQYINDDNIKIKQSFTIDIVDSVSPVIWLSGSYSVTEGSDINLLDKIMCGDNYDDNPKCEIIGDYDMNKPDTYPLTFKATDSSGNVTVKEFNLYVNKKVVNNNVSKPKENTQNTPIKPSGIQFSDIVKNYKTDKTEIGLDISEWQGKVDFDKLKKAGVEFVFLRVGGTKGITGDYFLDSRFIDNIKNANRVGIQTGIYFYSYANNKDKAIKDAKWVLKQIKGYKVDLPVAFDWENWSFYNEFKLSFFGLTDMADSFLNVFKSKGYDGLLYSSKAYLDDIWLESNYPVWLAHYTKKTNYEGKYAYWQLCDNGLVDGIDGNVDINIRYK